MYPINNASPERIAVGAVVQISDGAVQTSGVTVSVTKQGGSETGSAGTVAFSTGGICFYTPTQGETNSTSFIVTAYKTGCIPVAVSVITSASGTAGYAGVDWGVVANKTTTNALTGTTIATTQKVDVDTIKTNPVVNGGTITFPSNATLASTTNITAGTVDRATTSGTVSTVLSLTANADKTGYALASGQKVDVDTIKTNPVVNGGTITFPSNATLASTTNITAGTVDRATTAGVISSVLGNVGGSVASVVAAVAITSNIKTNQALAGFEFLMTDSTNHNPATGLTVTVTRSIDGGAFASGTLSAVTEVANGVYSVDFGAGDLNGKVIILQATEGASDTTFERIITQA